MKLNELDTFPELGNTIVLDGNIYVKKQEPLSLEELCKLYGDNVIEDIFAFARAIEKAHGIGGGE
jgi:hypothetical protein